MVLKSFTYFFGKKKKTIKVKQVSVFSIGLMFRKKSPPLLFKLKKQKKFTIFSHFCKPFTAIWLDDKKHIVKTEYIKKWKLSSGKGKYLLEIPTTTT
tara:strand:+ start:504 stop:794 length:291 start_codon:yes stop_codon:yes gene_type:complete